MGIYANIERNHKWQQQGRWFYTFCAPHVAVGPGEYRANVTVKRKACKRCLRVRSFPKGAEPPPSPLSGVVEYRMSSFTDPKATVREA